MSNFCNSVCNQQAVAVFIGAPGYWIVAAVQPWIAILRLRAAAYTDEYAI